MKVIMINQRTHFVRHWGRWYKVGKSGLEWMKLSPLIKKGIPDPKDPISAAALSLKQAKRVTPPVISSIDLDK